MKDKGINVRLIQAIVQAGIQIMGTRGHKVFGSYDITSPQHGLLSALEEYPEGISFREIGDHLMVSKANIGGLMARLEKKGLVTREASRKDGRVWLAKITPKGEKLLREVKPFRKKADAYVFADLSRAEKQKFLNYLHKTLKQLKSMEKVSDLNGRKELLKKPKGK